MRSLVLSSVLLLVPLSLAQAQSPTPPGARATKAQVAEPQRTYDDIKATLGIVPTFLKVFPPEAIPGAWQAMKGLQLNPDTAIPPRYKELIGLAVAAQIPCTYCVYFHREVAQLHGAEVRELNEAVAMAAVTRQWATYLNGRPQEMRAFRQEVDAIFDRAVGGAGEAGAGGEGRAPVEVTDAASARRDIEQTWGRVPTFINTVPDQALAGSWRELKAMELEESAIPAKYKSLIGLAVSAQVPCEYCVHVDTRAAKAAGATDGEIKEALGMAASTRHWSTVLNGGGVDEATFRRETQQILKHARRQSQPR